MVIPTVAGTLTSILIYEYVSTCTFLNRFRARKRTVTSGAIYYNLKMHMSRGQENGDRIQRAEYKLGCVNKT